MRIHWSLVLLAVIGTILITWHLRTKDMDFLAPVGVDPSQDGENSGIVVGDTSLQPEIIGSPETDPTLPEDLEAPVEPQAPVITDSDLGDLQSAPGLSEYRAFAKNNPPDSLFELSSILRTRGHFQRALLAIERIVDTSAPDPKLLTEAGRGIAALTPTLPRWNIDPEAEIPLTLHLSLARPASDQLKKALLEVALLIRQSSGDQLEIIPKIDSRDQSNVPIDSAVALWLSSTGETPVSSSVITLRLPTDQDLLFPEISLALFKAIRSHLGRSDFPEAITLDLGGPDLLATQITRLMWRDFSRSLTAPPAEEIEEPAPPTPN